LHKVAFTSYGEDRNWRRMQQTRHGPVRCAAYGHRPTSCPAQSDISSAHWVNEHTSHISYPSLPSYCASLLAYSSNQH